MNLIRYIIPLFAVVIFVLSCTIFNSDTVLIVKNQSNYFIDSTVFNVNGFTQKIIGIGINSEKKTKILQSLIPSNKHDVIAFVTVYLRGGKPLKIQDYNDLTVLQEKG